MPALNTNTVYCHLVDREDSDNLVVPGTVTIAGVAVAPVAELSAAPVSLERTAVTAEQIYDALVTLGLLVDIA